MLNINEANLWLSVGASFIVIITGLVAFIRFVIRRPSSNSTYRTFSQSGYIGIPPQKGVGYYFGCLLQAIVAIVIIIAGSTICTYITIALIYVFMAAHQTPSPYYTTP